MNNPYAIPVMDGVSAPVPPPCPAPCARTLEPADLVTKFQQELAARIDVEIALASATLTLLTDIRNLRLTNSQTYRRKEFATYLKELAALAVYRKELAALAASYDVEIVLVGDKSAAVPGLA